jgi:hypothetical protein
MATDEEHIKRFISFKLHAMTKQIEGYHAVAKEYDDDGKGELAHQQRMYTNGASVSIMRCVALVEGS